MEGVEGYVVSREAFIAIASSYAASDNPRERLDGRLALLTVRHDDEKRAGFYWDEIARQRNGVA